MSIEIRCEKYDAGLNHHIAAKKPATSKSVIICRNESTSRLEQSYFLDEKTFQTDRHQKTHLYRPANTRYDDRYIQPTRRSGRISAAIWGWISRDGPGEMTFISGRLNSVVYCDILEGVLIPTVDICYGGMANVVFM